MSTGGAAGLTARELGGVGKVGGSEAPAAAMAACTCTSACCSDTSGANCEKLSALEEVDRA